MPQFFIPLHEANWKPALEGAIQALKNRNFIYRVVSAGSTGAVVEFMSLPETALFDIGREYQKQLSRLEAEKFFTDDPL